MIDNYCTAQQYPLVHFLKFECLTYLNAYYIVIDNFIAIKISFVLKYLGNKFNY